MDLKVQWRLNSIYLLSAIVAAALVYSSSAFAQQGPTQFSLSGGLYNPNGTPITSNSVDFKVEVLDPTGTCVLFSELHNNENLSSTKGGFALQIGTGTGGVNNVAGGSALTSSVFENNGVTAVAGCAAQNFVSGDNRVVRVSYDLGSGFVAMNPTIPMTAAAYSMVAESVQGKRATDLVQIRNDNSTYYLGQTNIEWIFNNTNWPRLQSLLNGNSSQYMVTNPGADVSFNNRKIINVAAPTANTDATNKQYVDGNIAGYGAALTGIGLGSGGGSTLVWDQVDNRWEIGTPIATDNTKLPLAGGTMSGALSMGNNAIYNVSQIYNVGSITMADQSVLRLGSYTSAQEGLLALGTANAGTMFFNSTTGQLRVWNGTDYSGIVPGGAAGGDLTGTYPNPTIANNAITSAKINDGAVASADIADGTIATADIGNSQITSAKINNTGIAVNRILVTDASTGGTVTYATCAQDEILKFNSSTGWGCSTASSLIGNTTVTAGAYGSATSVATFTVDAQGRLTAATNTAIAFPVTSVAGRTGAVTLNWADVGGLGSAATYTQGTGAGQIPALDGSGRIPAVDGGLLTNVNAVRLQARSVSSAAPTDGQVLRWNNTLAQWEPSAIPSAPVSSVNGKTGVVTIELADIAGAGDITEVNTGNGLLGGATSGIANLSVNAGTGANQIVQIGSDGLLPVIDGSKLTNLNALRIQGRTVSATAPTADQVLRWNNSSAQWEAQTLVDGGITALTGDVVASGSGSVASTISNNAINSAKINNAGIAVNRLLITDASTGATVTYASCAQDEIMKFNSSTGWGCATDNSVTNAFVQGGNSFSQVATIGTNDNNRVDFETNDVARMTIDTTGNVGIGVLTPQTKLEVAGSIFANGGFVRSDLAVLNYASQTLTDLSGITKIGGYRTVVKGSLRVQHEDGETVSYLSGGSLGIGNFGATPGSILELTGTGTAYSSLIIPRETTALRPATGVNGMIRYNTTTARFEAFEGGSWVNMTAVGAGTGDFKADGTVPMTGAFRSIAGTGAVPGMTFVGDTDTGVWSPYGNAIAFSTFGSERLRIDGSGRVGIGTNNPTTELEISDSSSRLQYQAGNISTFYNSTFARTTYGNNGINGTQAGISFNINDAGGISNQGAGVGIAAQASLGFYTSNGTALTERMRINDSGYVGIGVNNPQMPLEVSGYWGSKFSSVYSVLNIGNQNAEIGSGTSNFTQYNTNNNLLGANNYDSNMFWIAGSGGVTPGDVPPVVVGDSFNNYRRVRIDPDGFTAAAPRTITNASTLYISGAPANGTNVTVTNPYAINVASGKSYLGGSLEIGGTGAESSVLLPRDTTVNRPATGVNGMIRYNTTTARFEAFEGGSWVNMTAVGAGTGDFKADGTVPMTGAFRSIAGTEGAPGMTFVGDTDTGVWAPTANTVAVSTAGTERVRINAQGYVGIGTASSSSPLAVYTGTVVTNLADFQAPVAKVKILATGGNGAYTAYGQGGVADTALVGTGPANGLVIGQGAGDLVLGAPNRNIHMFTSNGGASAQMSITSSGNVGIGTTAPGEKLEVSGAVRVNSNSIATPAQIQLYANTDSTNRQAAYITGSWSPSADATRVGNFGIWAHDFNGTPQPIFLGEGTTGGGQSTLYAGNSANVNVAVLANSAFNVQRGADNIFRVYHLNTDGYVAVNQSQKDYDFEVLGSGNSTPLIKTDAFAGTVGIGTSAPTAGARLDVTGLGTSYSSMIIPRDTTANRPTAGVNGMIRYNTTTARFEAFEGGSWVNVTAVGAGTGDFKADGTVPMTGAFRSIAGTAAAPGMTFVGDTDTGIYSPTGNSLAFSTFGSERIYIDGSGNVGVGTNSPIGSGILKMQVAGVGGGVNDYGSLALSNASGSGNNIAGALDYYTQGNLISSIRSQVIGGGNTGTLHLYTSNSGSLAKAMSLMNTGKVIVGGNDALYNTGAVFTVRANGSASTVRGININNEQTTNNSNSELGFVSIDQVGGPIDVATLRAIKSSSTPGAEVGQLAFYTRNSGSMQESVRIAGDGRVGIGTSTPSAGSILDLNGTGTAYSSLIVPRETTALRPTGVNGMIRYNTTTEKFEVFEGVWQNMITPQGAPSFPLLASPDGTAAAPAYSFSGDADNGMYKPSANRLAFSTFGTERLMIDSSGNVGLGITNPRVKLDVIGEAYFSDRVTFNGDPGGWGSRIYNDTTPYVLGFNSRDGFLFRVLTVPKFAIDASGNVGIGTGTPASGLDIVATGLYSSVIVPRDTTANRPGTGVNGMIRYNTTTARFEAFESGSWVNVTAVGAGTGDFKADGTVPMTGAFRSIAGTDAAPGMTFVGDTDTGVWSPGANTVALSTFGTERVRINSSGNLGIGSSNPLFKVHIASDASYIFMQDTDSTDRNVGIDLQTAGGDWVIRSGQEGTTASDLYIARARNGSNRFRFGRDDYAFALHDSVGTEKVYLSANDGQRSYFNAGPVVMGSTSATAGTQLDINGTGSAYSSILVPRDTTALRPTVGVNGMIRYNTTTQKFEVFEGVWQNMITPQGAPTFPLLASPDGTAASPAYSFSGDADNGMFKPSPNYLGFSTFGTQRLTIDGSGNVGIGIEAPVANLHLPASTKMIVNSNTTLTGSANYGLEVGGYLRSSQWDLVADKIINLNGGLTKWGNHYPGDISFVTANGTAGSMTERMRIEDVSGNVGIGTTSVTAGARLEIAGTGVGDSSILIPRGLTAARPTVGVNGMIRFNTTTQKFEAYEGVWQNMISSGAGASSIDGLSDAIYDSVDQSYYIGVNSGAAAADADFNTAVGYGSLQAVTDGDYMTAVGWGALNKATTGTNTVAFGEAALFNWVSGDGNTAVGTNALDSTTGGNANTAVGQEALGNGSGGSYNTGIGRGALREGAGATENTAVGWDAALNTTGSYNTAIGSDAIFNNTSGQYNVALGHEAGEGASTAAKNRNVFIGSQAGKATTTADNNIFIGYQTGNTISDGDNNIFIGYQVQGSGASAASELNIGNLIYGNLATGRMAVGATTTTAGSILDLNGTGVAYSSMIVPRDTTALRPTAGVNGMIRYNTTTQKFEVFEGVWQNMIAVSNGADITDVVAGNGLLGGAASGAATLSVQFPMASTSNGSAGAPAYSFSGDADNGMYKPSTNQLSFATFGTERIRVDGSGRVGIGTTTPGATLDVIGNITTSSTITNGGFDFFLGTSDQVSRGNTGLSRALVKNGGAVLTINYVGDFSGGTVIHGATGTPNLFVSGAANGGVGIGNTTPSYELDVTGSMRATTAVYSAAFNYTSDGRLKTNVQEIPDPLNVVNALRGVTFDWKSTGQKDVGFIAQEVEKVVPELVSTGRSPSGEEMKSVKYGNIVAIVVEAVKELYQKVTRAEERIQRLEEENAQLKTYLCEKDANAPFCRQEK